MILIGWSQPKRGQTPAVLGVGRSKVYELMAGGQLPSVHIGKLRRIPSTCLAEYVERLRQDAA